MDLNIARQPGQKATPEALVRAIKRGDAILARTLSEETYLNGATTYTSPRAPGLAIANAAMDLRLPIGVTAATVLDHVESDFAGRGLVCQRLDASEQAWPAELAEEAQRRGYREQRCEVAALQQWVSPGASSAVQVIPARAALAETLAMLKRMASQGAADPAGAEQNAAAMMDQLDDSRLDLFLARIARKPAAIAGVLTLGNIGIVTDFFADEGVQRGEALNTLADRLFDHCQRAQFEQVIAVLDADQGRAAILGSLGFRPVATFVRFVR